MKKFCVQQQTRCAGVLFCAPTLTVQQDMFVYTVKAINAYVMVSLGTRLSNIGSINSEVHVSTGLCTVFLSSFVGQAFLPPTIRGI